MVFIAALLATAPYCLGAMTIRISWASSSGMGLYAFISPRPSEYAQANTAKSRPSELGYVSVASFGSMIPPDTRVSPYGAAFFAAAAPLPFSGTIALGAGISQPVPASTCLSPNASRSPSGASATYIICACAGNCFMTANWFSHLVKSNDRGAIRFTSAVIVSFCDTFVLWWKSNSPEMPRTTSTGPKRWTINFQNGDLSYQDFLYRARTGGVYSNIKPTMTQTVASSANNSNTSSADSNMLDVYMARWERQLERERITMIAALSAIGVGIMFVIGYATFHWLTGR